MLSYDWLYEFQVDSTERRKHLFPDSLRETKRIRAKDKLVIKDSSYFPSIKDIESVHFLSLILLPMTGFLQKCDVITLLLLRKQQLRKRTEHIPY